MSMNIEATRVIRPLLGWGLTTHKLLLLLWWYIILWSARLGSLRLPVDTDPDKLTVAANMSGCAGLCSSYSSDSVNELKRIKTRSQTFTQPCASGWRSGQQNHTTRCWCWRGRRPLTKYKQAIYINLRLAPSMTTNRGIVPLLWALRGLVDQETTTRQRSTFIIIMVNVVFPVLPQKNNNQDACRHG